MYLKESNNSTELIVYIKIYIIKTTTVLSVLTCLVSFCYLYTFRQVRFLYGISCIWRRLLNYLYICRIPLNLKEGDSRIFYGLDSEYMAVSVVGLGKARKERDPIEEIDIDKETVRIAAAAGAHALKSIGVEVIETEHFDNAEAAAEGIALKLYSYDDLATEKKPKPILELYREQLTGEIKAQWEKGLIKAEAQNLARRLTEAPANLMTPQIFADIACRLLRDFDNVEVEIREKCWAEEKGMNSFLSVTRGSKEPPIFLEISYYGIAKEKPPIVLIGKGITFDSGGINLKSSSGLAHMRGDMGGAANVLATVYAARKLCFPLNIKALMPLCENMPSGTATKTGDVIVAMNGKKIRVDNTDAEGRLILADALCYSKCLNPRFVLDIATLTGSIAEALGIRATGVFSNSNNLWREIHAAGTHTGDRLWRMPLWKAYLNTMKDSSQVLNNISKKKGGGSCTAAAFLREFVPPVEWLHLDMAGVMGPDDDTPYLGPGMTGRPTRTIIQFLSSLK